MAVECALQNLNNKELLSETMNLVDRASTTQLIDCYENIFKVSIMKFILKTVLKQEIEQVTKPNVDDWKRISLIAKIKKLAPPSKSKTATLPPIDKYETSTEYLLLNGYLRNEIHIENNNYVPKDIVSIAQQFLGDCSNITNNKQLIVFNHTANSYKSMFDTHNIERVVQPIVSAQKFKSLLLSNMNKTLISPYKILFQNNENAFMYNEIPHFPDAEDISASIQQIGSFKFSSKKPSNTEPPIVNSSTTPLHIPQFPAVETKKYICGVVQYLDINNLTLINFGGIEKIDCPSYGYRYQNYNSKACKYIHALDLSSMYKEGGEWEKTYSLTYARGYMSVCQVNDSKVAIIGGKTYSKRKEKTDEMTYYYNYYSNNTGSQDSVETVVDSVELYDLKLNNSIPMRNLNHPRTQCGSYYNNHANEIITFGGTETDGRKITNWSKTSGNTAEIFDLHKNVWIDVPYYTAKQYIKYPIIWTVGSKCIFVAQYASNYGWGKSKMIDCEWIDLRVCDKSGKNKSTWNKMHLTEPHPDGSSNCNFTVF